jgi:hypothetical protein
MKNYDELITNIRGLFNDSTQGKWKKGATSHQTVTETGYKIGEFHHASDAAFCDYMHAHAEYIITAIQELQAENHELNQDYYAKCAELDIVSKFADDAAAAHKVERDGLMGTCGAWIKMHTAARQCEFALRREIDELRAKLSHNGHSAEHWNKLAVMRWQEVQELEAKLAALEQQEPVAARWPTVPGSHKYCGCKGCADLGGGMELLYLAAGAALQPAQWKPIETAPKDSSRILIYCPKSNRPVQEVWWAIPYEGAVRGYWSTPIGPTGRGYTILETSPTHWMPLPPAPQGDQQ